MIALSRRIQKAPTNLVGALCSDDSVAIRQMVAGVGIEPTTFGL
jgi:hypothetical protein